MEKNGETLIRRFITEVLTGKKVGASKSYMKKEELRQKLQEFLQNEVAAGVVKNQEELDEWWSTVEMAAGALKMVPFMAWISMNKKV